MKLRVPFLITVGLIVALIVIASVQCRNQQRQDRKIQELERQQSNSVWRP